MTLAVRDLGERSTFKVPLEMSLAAWIAVSSRYFRVLEEEFKGDVQDIVKNLIQEGFLL